MIQNNLISFNSNIDYYNNNVSGGNFFKCIPEKIAQTVKSFQSPLNINLKTAVLTQVVLTTSFLGLSILLPGSMPLWFGFYVSKLLIGEAACLSLYSIYNIKSFTELLNKAQVKRLSTLEILELQKFKKVKKIIKLIANFSDRFLKIKNQIEVAQNKNHIFKILKKCKTNSDELKNYCKYWNLPKNSSLKNLKETMLNNYDPKDESILEYCETDPFIHGTNSAIFSLLPRTDQKLMPVSEMLNRNMAPMSGELFGGGLSTALADGRTCFSKLNDYYGLNECIGTYTNYIWDSNGLDKYLSTDRIAVYSFLELKVAIIRERQAGSPFSKKKIQAYKNHLNEKEHLIQTRLLWIAFILQFVQLKTKEDSISVYKLCSRPDFPEEFKSALENKNEFAIPSEWKNILGLEDRLYDIKHPSQLKNEIDQTNRTDYEYLCEIKPSDIRYSLVDSTDNRLISKSLDQKLILPSKYGKDILPKYLDEINNYSKLIKKLKEDCIELLLNNKKVKKLPSESMNYIRNQFPMIIFSTNQELIEPCKGEYRSTQPLKLGQEITMIACENKDRHLIDNYLKKYNIQNITLVDINFIKRYTYHN